MIKYVQYPFLWLQSIFQWFGRWISFLLENKQPDSKKNTIAVLDGVRGVAVLMVMVFHIDRMTGDNLWSRVTYPLSTSISTAGGTGVTLFFVLSGFLLFMPFAKALLYKTRWPLARVFYLRRALRIIPAYYVSLFLLILFTHPEYLHRDHLKDLFLFATFFMDSTRTTFRPFNGACEQYRSASWESSRWAYLCVSGDFTFSITPRRPSWYPVHSLISSCSLRSV